MKSMLALLLDTAGVGICVTDEQGRFVSHLAPISRTGKMPVPQRLNFLVGWASCPPVTGLLTMVQDVSFVQVSVSHLAPISRTGKMPVPQRLNFLVGWASCPPVTDLLTMVQDVSFVQVSSRRET